MFALFLLMKQLLKSVHLLMESGDVVVTSLKHLLLTGRLSDHSGQMLIPDLNRASDGAFTDS